tara:strand:+ start:297 stop:554 length:258 start_codon:yes stop_codon:yes gene_type:complete
MKDGEIKVELQNENGIYLTYKLTHLKNGYLNIYEIDAKICGITECKENSLFITTTSCNTLSNNEETLLDEFAIDLLDYYLRNYKK